MGNIEFVYFSHVSAERAICLGGSPEHLVGAIDHSQQSSIHVTPSMMSTRWPGTIEAIGNAVSEQDDPYDILKIKYSGYASDDPEFVRVRQARLHDLYQFHANRHEPVQQLEFLAKRLFDGKIGENSDDVASGKTGDSPNAYVFAGTPIYVALAE